MYVRKPDEIADAVTTALRANGPVVIEMPVAEYFPAAAPTPGSSSKASH
jgi:thiamine pyrophosphate-dependent acetolactate synthase large subunit-like protein